VEPGVGRQGHFPGRSLPLPAEGVTNIGVLPDAGAYGNGSGSQITGTSHDFDARISLRGVLFEWRGVSFGDDRVPCYNNQKTYFEL
jgi:hypothetical protein